MRNSRTPGAALAATVTFSLIDATVGGGNFTPAGFASSPGTTSMVTPVPSTSTLYAPNRVLVRQSTVTSAVVPRCTATGVTWVTIGNEIWAAAAAGSRARARSV